MTTSRVEKQERMFTLIEQYLQSSQTQPEYCRSISVPLSTFYFWLKKYRQRQCLQSPSQPSSQSSFVPMTIALPGPMSGHIPQSIIIQYPNGVRIRINGAPDTKQILELIHGRPSHDF
jgi:transposase-like protein